MVWISKGPEPPVWRTVASVVLLYNWLLAVIVMAPVIVLRRATGHLSWREHMHLAFVSTLVGGALVLWLLRWQLRRESRGFDELGWRRSGGVIWPVFALACGAAYAIQLLGRVLVPDHELDVGLIKVVGVVVAVFAAIVEELVFRGYLLSEMKRRGTSAVWCVIASGVAFATIHGGPGLLGSIVPLTMFGSGPSVLTTFAMGALLGILYLGSRQALLPCILCRASVCVVVEPWLLVRRTAYLDTAWHVWFG